MMHQRKRRTIGTGPRAMSDSRSRCPQPNPGEGLVRSHHQRQHVLFTVFPGLNIVFGNRTGSTSKATVKIPASLANRLNSPE